MKLYAHFCLSRSGSNCLFSAITNTVKGSIQKEIRFNKLRINLIYQDILFTKVRRFVELEYLHLKPNKCIFNYRKDKVRQAISNYIVDTCGIDTTRKEHITKKDLDDIHLQFKIDKTHFLEYMSYMIPKLKQIEHSYLRYFLDNHIPYKPVSYEDLFTDYEGTVKSTIKFLFNIEIAETIPFYTHSASSALNVVLLQMYEENNVLDKQTT